MSIACAISASLIGAHPLPVITHYTKTVKLYRAIGVQWCTITVHLDCVKTMRNSAALLLAAVKVQRG